MADQLIVMAVQRADGTTTDALADLVQMPDGGWTVTGFRDLDGDPIVLAPNDCVIVPLDPG